jgi:hypothetical protein
MNLITEHFEKFVVRMVHADLICHFLRCIVLDFSPVSSSDFLITEEKQKKVCEQRFGGKF